MPGIVLSCDNADIFCTTKNQPNLLMHIYQACNNIVFTTCAPHTNNQLHLQQWHSKWYEIAECFVVYANTQNRCDPKHIGWIKKSPERGIFLDTFVIFIHTHHMILKQDSFQHIRCLKLYMPTVLILPLVPLLACN